MTAVGVAPFVVDDTTPATAWRKREGKNRDRERGRKGPREKGS